MHYEGSGWDTLGLAASSLPGRQNSGYLHYSRQEAGLDGCSDTAERSRIDLNNGDSALASYSAASETPPGCLDV